MNRAAIALAVLVMCGCGGKPNLSSVKSVQNTARVAAKVVTTLPPISLQELLSCNRKATIAKPPSEEFHRPKPPLRVLSNFQVGEEVYETFVYSMSGEIFICCSSSELYNLDGRWVNFSQFEYDSLDEPAVTVHLRRVKDGFLLDCDSTPRIVDNDKETTLKQKGASSMFPIVGTFRSKP